jgi:tricorn protease
VSCGYDYDSGPLLARGPELPGWLTAYCLLAPGWLARPGPPMSAATMRCPKTAPLPSSADVDLLAELDDDTAPGRGWEQQPYCSWPTVHGRRLAFVTEGQLWLVDAMEPGSGGAACPPRRITDCAGAQVSRPRFSPDGTLLAYSLLCDGYEEVYCCAVRAVGRARRLTYLGASCARVVGWSRNGRAVVFASSAACADNAVSGALTLWRVEVGGVRGGGAIPLGLGEAHTLVLQPPPPPPLGTDEPEAGQAAGVLIGRHTGDPAVDEWKRYRGGRQGQLWMDARGSGSFTRLQPMPTGGGGCGGGQIGSPLWLRRGSEERIFFVSDHNHHQAEANAGAGAGLFSCDTSGQDLAAHFLMGVGGAADYFMRHVASDGTTLVWVAGGQLYQLPADHARLWEQRCALPPPSGADGSLVPHAQAASPPWPMVGGGVSIFDAVHFD